MSTLGRAIATNAAMSVGTSFALGSVMRMVPDEAFSIEGDVSAVIGAARSIGRGARFFARGSEATRAMSGRGAGDGAIGSRHLVVAGEFLHGPGDRSAALASITADFVALQSDIEHGAQSPADAAWALGDIVPALAAWNDFVSRERSSALAPYVTDWSAFTSWQERLVRLRELARARGIELGSPEPVPLPKTVWERGGEGSGNAVDKYMALVKWAVYAALGILGFASLYAALRSVRYEIVRRSVLPI